MRDFKNSLKHIFWKPLKPMRDFEKKNNFETIFFENHWNQWEILKSLWNNFFENHWNLWEILKSLWNVFFLKTIETYERFWKVFETIFLKTIETYERFRKVFETIFFENHWNLWEILEHFETHVLKNIKSYGGLWKHFETQNMKTIETYGRFRKHFDTPLSYGHSGVAIETLGFQMALKWNTWGCAVMYGEKICFLCCWKYKLHYYCVKQLWTMYLDFVTLDHTNKCCYSYCVSWKLTCSHCQYQHNWNSKCLCLI